MIGPRTEIVSCEKQKLLHKKVLMGENLRLFLLAYEKSNVKLEVKIELEKAAGVEVFIVLLAGEKQNLNLDCEVILAGAETKASIVARSIVAEDGKKKLRSVLNFESGAGGTQGHEEENVLILGSRASSESTPIILCGESEVKASHALSSGNIDKKALFYLMSRGLDELTAQRLLAKAALMGLIELLPHETIRMNILKRVDELIAGGTK